MTECSFRTRMVLPASVAVLLLVAAGWRVAAANPEPAAIIIDLSGDVTVVDPTGQSMAAGIGVRLYEKSRVIPASQAAARVLHRSGLVETIDSATTIAMARSVGSGTVFSRTIATLDQVGASDRPRVLRAAVIRRIPGAPEAIAPRNEITVLSTRPLFTWSAVDQAEGYVLQLRPLGGAAVRFEVGYDTTWTIPDSLPALMPGTGYTWTVVAMPSERSARPERFRTALPEERKALQEDLDGIIIRRSPLLEAVIHYEHGFLYEAKHLLDELLTSGSELDHAVHCLQADVYGAIGESSLAARARARGRCIES